MNEEGKRGPGRPPKYLTEEVKLTEAIEVNPPRRRREKSNVFGGMVQKLAYPERPGYHRHWFKDIPGRIAWAEQGGYSHVKGDDDGKNVVRVTGVLEGGGPEHSYLMEIPEEWYQEDMDAQSALIAQKEDSILRVPEQNEKGYVPSQGISIRHDGQARKRLVSGPVPVSRKFDRE